jgi:hypothetical protein
VRGDRARPATTAISIARASCSWCFAKSGRLRRRLRGLRQHWQQVAMLILAKENVVIVSRGNGPDL